MSFGASRDFMLRHNQQRSRKLRFPLGNGDALVMAGEPSLPPPLRFPSGGRVAAGTRVVVWHASFAAVRLFPATLALYSHWCGSMHFRSLQSAWRAAPELLTRHLAMCTGTTQDHWMHAVPKRAGVAAPRVNLTFRTVVHLEGGRRACGQG